MNPHRALYFAQLRAERLTRRVDRLASLSYAILLLTIGFVIGGLI